MTPDPTTWQETWHNFSNFGLLYFCHIFLSKLVAWYLPHFRVDSVDRWFVVTSLTSPYRLKYQEWTAGHQLLYSKMMGWHGKSMENHPEIIGNLWDDMGMEWRLVDLDISGCQKNSPWLPGFHQETGPKSGMLVVKESLHKALFWLGGIAVVPLDWQ